MDRSKHLGEEKISKLLLKFSIPATVGMLVNAIYNVVDRIFIGNGVGSLGIAGVTVGFPVMLLVMAFAMLMGFGATSLISLKLGEQKKEEAEQILGNGIILLIVVSLVISGIGLLFLDPLLTLFGASEKVLPYARDYMQIILLGTVLMSPGFGMSNFIRAEGNPRYSMYIMLIGSIINIILNPIFIFILDWGVRGAALATVISRAVSTIWAGYYFTSGKSVLKIHPDYFKLNLPIISRIIAIGSAPFAMQLANSLLGVIMNNSLEHYGGDIAIAGMGVVMSIITLIVMPIMGINQGAQPIIGYNYGAKNFDRVKEALKQAVLVATIIVTLGFLVTRLYPAYLIAFFNPDDPALIEFGSNAVRIFLIALPIIGFQVVGSNYFQAIGKPKQAMFLSLSRQVVLLIPLMLILPRFYGLDGILYSGPVADFGSAILTAIWLFMELKNLTKRHNEQNSHSIEPPINQDSLLDSELNKEGLHGYKR